MSLRFITGKHCLLWTPIITFCLKCNTSGLGKMVLLGRVLYLQSTLPSPQCHPFSFLLTLESSMFLFISFFGSSQCLMALCHHPAPSDPAAPCLALHPCNPSSVWSSLSFPVWRLTIVHDFEPHRIGVVVLWLMAPLEITPWVSTHCTCRFSERKLGCPNP
jgi:hypothetical protein